ncbi:MAG: alpha/beta hydrolase [Hyphomicrobiaceae bacterium]
MPLGEFVTIAIIAVLIIAMIMAVLLGYGRRIGRGWKTLGWLVVIALIALPAALLFLGDLGPMSQDEMAAPAQEEELSGSAPKSEMPSGTRSAAPKASKPAADSNKVPETFSTTTERKPDGTTVTRTIRSAPSTSTAEAEPQAVEAAPEPEAAEVAAAVTDEKFDVVKVFFGTDRKQTPDDKRLKFGSGRADELTLGRASVTIPKQNHERGSIERPREWSVLGITIYREKENPERHFTVQKIGILDENAFIQAANAQLASSKEYRKQAVVFVHGYNNSFDHALYRSAQMIYDMRFDGAPFLYSWPSAEGVSTYEQDQNAVRSSIPHLRRFIQLVTEQTDAEQIHLVAHSMGNDVLLEALRELRFKYGPDHDYKISQVIFAAPDVDRKVFENIAGQISGMSRGMTLYASANDKALQASKTYARGLVRAGDVPSSGPVVMSGMDTIDVSETQQDFWALNHNTYAEVSELQQDIKQLLLTGLRPPKSRTPSLQPINTASGTYWRFPASAQ